MLVDILKTAESQHFCWQTDRAHIYREGVHYALTTPQFTPTYSSVNVQIVHAIYIIANTVMQDDVTIAKLEGPIKFRLSCNDDS